MKYVHKNIIGMNLSRCIQILEVVSLRGHLENKIIDVFTDKCIKEAILKIEFILGKRQFENQA